MDDGVGNLVSESQSVMRMEMSGGDGVKEAIGAAKDDGVRMTVIGLRDDKNTVGAEVMRVAEVSHSRDLHGGGAGVIDVTRRVFGDGDGVVEVVKVVSDSVRVMTVLSGVSGEQSESGEDGGKGVIGGGK
jgi:hypothetical protein